MHPLAHTFSDIARDRHQTLLLEAAHTRLLQQARGASGPRLVLPSLRTRLATALRALARAIDDHAALAEPQPLIG